MAGSNGTARKESDWSSDDPRYRGGTDPDWRRRSASRAILRVWLAGRSFRLRRSNPTGFGQSDTSRIRGTRRDASGFCAGRTCCAAPCRRWSSASGRCSGRFRRDRKDRRARFPTPWTVCVIEHRTSLMPRAIGSVRPVDAVRGCGRLGTSLCRARARRGVAGTGRDVQEGLDSLHEGAAAGDGGDRHGRRCCLRRSDAALLPPRAGSSASRAPPRPGKGEVERASREAGGEAAGGGGGEWKRRWTSPMKRQRNSIRACRRVGGNRRHRGCEDARCGWANSGSSEGPGLRTTSGISCEVKHTGRETGGRPVSRAQR